MDGFRLAPDQWAALRRLLDEALDLEPERRAAWLEALEGESAAYRPRLASLLAHAGDGAAAKLLHTLPKVETDQFAPRPPGSGAPDEAIGPYRLLRQLGEGGMASVWLAVRTDMLQGRQVALKLPHGAWRRAGLAERLQREREILATLEHPNIARLYDAGVDTDGQPWLALELVQGERIDAHCERLALGVPQRLQLFLQVARAVAHAHANLVVHRDLKPSNILVTDAGEVKLLDFGIAKLLDQGVVAETALTQAAGRALTPDYAAPEQILGRPVGTAADIYSLGVVLFELLAGARPYRLARESRAALEEAVLSADVPRPSSVAPEARRKALRGDLDTIVLKALKAAPAERYPTVDALADDLQRHLDHRPVQAQPDRLGYRLRKFVARNRLAVGAAGVVFLAVATGAALAVWQARVAVAEKARADEVKTFIAELLRDANPALQGGRKIGVDELLKSSRGKIDAKFADRPLIRAELLTIVATSLSSIGEIAAALPLLEDAVKASTEALGAEHPQTLHSRAMWVGGRRNSDPGPALTEEADRVIAAMRRTKGVDPAYFVNLLAVRAQMAMDEGRHDLSVPHAEEALRVAIRELGETKEQTLNTAVNLAFVHQRAGDWRNALEAARRVHRIALQSLKLPDAHPNAVDARLMLGLALADAGQLAEGIAELEAGVRNALVHRKPTETAIGSFRTHLARTLLRAGRHAEAVGHLEAALEIQRHALGPKNRRYASAANDLAGGWLAARRPERALSLLREANGYFAGSPDGLAAVVAARLAAALAATGALAEAQAAAAPLSASKDGEVLLRRASVERRAGRGAQALALLQQALAALPDVPAQQAMRAEVLIEQAGLRLDGVPAEALADFDRAAAQLRAAQLVPTPALADALAGSGRALLVLGRAPEAAARLDEAAAIWRSADPAHPAAAEIATLLADARR